MFPNATHIILCSYIYKWLYYIIYVYAIRLLLCKSLFVFKELHCQNSTEVALFLLIILLIAQWWTVIDTFIVISLRGRHTHTIMCRLRLSDVKILTNSLRSAVTILFCKFRVNWPFIKHKIFIRTSFVLFFFRYFHLYLKTSF